MTERRNRKAVPGGFVVGMSSNRSQEKVCIVVTIPESEVRDALLILGDYACSDYSVDFCSLAETADLSIDDDKNAPAAKVEVSAKCALAAAPTLIAELFAAYGRDTTLSVAPDLPVAVSGRATRAGGNKGSKL